MLKIRVLSPSTNLQETEIEEEKKPVRKPLTYAPMFPTFLVPEYKDTPTRAQLQKKNLQIKETGYARIPTIKQKLYSSFNP